MKHFLFCLTLFCFFNSGLLAQAPDMAIIQSQLDTTQDPSKFCQIAAENGYKLRIYNQLEDAIALIDLGLLKAREHQLKHQEVSLLMERANVLDMRGQTDSALAGISASIRLAKNIAYESEGQLYKIASRFYKKANNLDSAVHYLTLAESWYKQQSPETRYYLWSVYDHWHSLYLQFGDLNKAEEYLNKAYSIVREWNKKIDIGYVLNRLQGLSLIKADAEQYARYHKAYY